MKHSWLKIFITFVLVFFSSLLILIARAEIRKSGGGKVNSDTTGIKSSKLPSEAEEIEIGENGIVIRTKEGERIVVGKGQTGADISLDENRIKIGDKTIDLGDLEDSLKVKIPKIEISAPRIHVRSGGEDIVKFGKDVVIEEDETIDGSVVIICGNLEVKGTVNEDAVAIWGDVKVDSTGVIEGGVVSVGGEIKKEDGATVRGQKTTVSFGPKGLFRLTPFTGGFYGFAFFARIIKIILFLFIGIVVISIVPRHVSKVKDKISEDFFKCALIGFVAEILILPVFLLLIITIIGIPLAILVEPLLVVATFILGYTGVSYFIGEKLKARTSLKPETPIMTLIIGILAVEAVLLLARVVGILGHPLTPISWILTFFGWAFWYVVITVGFGAAILTRLGTRPKDPFIFPITAAPPDKGSTGEAPLS
ncbi:MAG: hypothetical protein ABII96_07020 [Candidatus Zixiibacteriota bacterium]